jgi:hypothetical protein
MRCYWKDIFVLDSIFVWISIMVAILGIEFGRRVLRLGRELKQKRFASSSFVCDVVHIDGECHKDEDTTVVCFSQNIKKLSDIEAEGKDCLLANDKIGVHHLKGIPLIDFMDMVADIYLHQDTGYLIVYKAFMLLEEDFSNILSLYGAMKEYRYSTNDKSPFKYN